MDLSSVSRLAAPTGPVTSASLASTGRPSAVKAQQLGLKFSSLNGKPLEYVVGATGRCVKRNAGRKSGRNVRAEQTATTNAIQSVIERVPDHNLTHDIVHTTLTGKVTVVLPGEDGIPKISIQQFIKLVQFCLYSTELDAQGSMKMTAKTQLHDDNIQSVDGKLVYLCEITFTVNSDFGEPGAVMVYSKSPDEFFLQSLNLVSTETNKPYDFPCNSWINQKSEENYKLIASKDQFRPYFKNEITDFDRIFFTNKVYLPKETPAGLNILRSLEMHTMRGNGTGERKPYDRVYDYDVYNDLGDAEKGILRPILGGPGNIPYPRRCRTGRPVDEKTGMEKRPPLLPGAKKLRAKSYVPRDEDFSTIKDTGFQSESLVGIQSTLVPGLKAKFDETPDDFDNMDHLYGLYTDGLNLLPENPSTQPLPAEKAAVQEFLKTYVVGAVAAATEGAVQVDKDKVDLDKLKYPSPQIVDEPKDHMAWMNDEEFGRQTLAGINPVVIKRAKVSLLHTSLFIVTVPDIAVYEASCLSPFGSFTFVHQVFPPVSSLPQDIWGPGTALTAEHIEPYLRTHGKKMTVAEAIAEKRLFTVDYRDVYLPYIQRINSQEQEDPNNPGTFIKRRNFLYAPRAFFFLTDDKKMKPVAIELSLPPPYNGEDKPLNRVFTPPNIEHEHDSEWELAKLHFNSVDFGYHELVSHWLRTHCVMEPFIIASHRQLSAMHPIFALLEPTFVNTMRINANARASLIASAPDGTIESNFTPGAYGNELAAVVYAKFWRFDKVGLPQDLLERGMAQPDYLESGGVKLLFDDYPFAKDALDVWNATREYITDYVNIHYSSDEQVREDEELQAWWKEIREVGHGDKKDEPWWPSCKTIDSLIGILCNIFWIAGPNHAAVNFGQYGYCGFMLNRPPMTRLPIPEPNTPEYKKMCYDFEGYMFKSVSSPMQTILIMTTLRVLSSHAQDEEYIGKRLDIYSNWTSNPKVKQVFDKYAATVQRLETMFEQRNKRQDLKNRHGALEKSGYTLMYPTSGPGVTGRGIPWSISI